MCRLLCTVGKTKVWSKIMFEFQKQADIGKIPPISNMKPGHKDGWGLAKSNNEKTGMEIVGRFLGSAMETSEYKQIIDSLTTPPRIFISHLRKASSGVQISLANAHPFQYKEWVFSHNGTVYNASKLMPDSKFRLTSDDSDSEYYFHYLLSYILNKKLTHTIPEKIIEALLNINVSFTSLNSMFSNGSDLYAIRYCTKHHDYYSLYSYETTDGIMISSEPIHISELDASLWKEIPNRSVVRVSNDPLKLEIFEF